MMEELKSLMKVPPLANREAWVPPVFQGSGCDSHWVEEEPGVNGGTQGSHCWALEGQEFKQALSLGIQHLLQVGELGRFSGCKPGSLCEELSAGAFSMLLPELSPPLQPRKC